MMVGDENWAISEWMKNPGYNNSLAALILGCGDE
jgi:hypothetical protein